MADTTGKPADRSAVDAQVRDSRVPDARNQPRGRPDMPSPSTMRPAPLNREETERLEELRARRPNPAMLPPDVRTEDEEMEFRALSQRETDAVQQAARDAARPMARLNPQQRLDELGKTPKGEGADIERRRLEELVADEKRVAELKAMPQRVAEEDDELAMLQARVAEARAAGGFDPNG